MRRAILTEIVRKNVKNAIAKSITKANLEKSMATVQKDPRTTGLNLYMWLTYRTFALKRPLRLTWPQLYRLRLLLRRRLSRRLRRLHRVRAGPARFRVLVVPCDDFPRVEYRGPGRCYPFMGASATPKNAALCSVHNALQQIGEAGDGAERCVFDRPSYRVRPESHRQGGNLGPQLVQVGGVVTFDFLQHPERPDFVDIQF